MPIIVVTEYLKKATVRVIAHIYNDAGELATPTAVKVSIYAPEATTPTVDGAAMTKNTDASSPAYGAYEYYFATTVDTEVGWWRGEVEVTDGTDPIYTSMDSFGFNIG